MGKTSRQTWHERLHSSFKRTTSSIHPIPNSPIRPNARLPNFRTRSSSSTSSRRTPPRPRTNNQRRRRPLLLPRHLRHHSLNRRLRLHGRPLLARSRPSHLHYRPHRDPTRRRRHRRLLHEPQVLQPRSTIRGYRTRWLQRHQAGRHRARDFRAREIAAGRELKPLNLIVLTDGVPSDDVESVLLSAAKKLDKLEAPPFQIGVQFFQVGNEEGAKEALEELDDGLSELVEGGVRDIVDTVTWTGGRSSSDGGIGLTGDGILKAVLGAVVKRLDRRRASGEVRRR